MKFSILSLITILIFISCENAKKDTVKLTILNPTISYFSPKDSSFYLNHRGYQDSLQEEKSINIVKYRLSNPTDKKLLFFIRDLYLSKIYGMSINVNKNKKYLQPVNILSNPAFLDSCSLIQLQEQIDENSKESHKIYKTGAKNIEFYKKYLTQTVVLYPGETREFSTILSLPFFSENESNIFMGGNSFFDLYAENDYKIFIEYEMRKSITNYLTTEQKEDLKRNDIEIFYGKVSSNQVELTPHK